MAVVTREDLTQRLTALGGDSPSDDVLSLIDDVTDTFNSFNTGDDWKTRYEENDKAWRKRYSNRFLKKPEHEEPDEEPDEERTKTIDELFKEVK